MFFSIFYDLVKLFCELCHKFLINLRLRQKFNLESSVLFLKNLRSAAAPTPLIPLPPPTPSLQIRSTCSATLQKKQKKSSQGEETSWWRKMQSTMKNEKNENQKWKMKTLPKRRFKSLKTPKKSRGFYLLLQRKSKNN